MQQQAGDISTQMQLMQQQAGDINPQHLLQPGMVLPANRDPLLYPQQPALPRYVGTIAAVPGQSEIPGTPPLLVAPPLIADQIEVALDAVLLCLHGLAWTVVDKINVDPNTHAKDHVPHVRWRDSLKLVCEDEDWRKVRDQAIAFNSSPIPSGFLNIFITWGKPEGIGLKLKAIACGLSGLIFSSFHPTAISFTPSCVAVSFISTCGVSGNGKGCIKERARLNDDGKVEFYNYTVDCLEIVSDYFDAAAAVDVHDHLRQGMIEVNAFLTYKIEHPHGKYEYHTDFTNQLALEQINNPYANDAVHRILRSATDAMIE
eukprot:Awhi_evm2s3513